MKVQVFTLSTAGNTQTHTHHNVLDRYLTASVDNTCRTRICTYMLYVDKRSDLLSLWGPMMVRFVHGSHGLISWFYINDIEKEISYNCFLLPFFLYIFVVIIVVLNSYMWIRKICSSLLLVLPVCKLVLAIKLRSGNLVEI